VPRGHYRPALIKVGEDLLQQGDIAAARTVLKRAATANLEALESRNIDAYVATGRARDAVAGTAMPSPEPPIHSFWIRFSPPSASTDCQSPLDGGSSHRAALRLLPIPLDPPRIIKVPSPGRITSETGWNCCMSWSPR
jgi:hypothetical protein